VKLKTFIFYVFLGFFSIVSSVSSAQSQSLAIAALGDSITAGLMRDSQDEITCPHIVECDGNGATNIGGFAPFLNTRLRDKGYSSNVFNWGYSGETSQQLVNRVSAVITLSSPSHITIMAGANDAIDNVSQNTLKFNIDIMAKIAISRNVTPVLATVTPDPRLLIYEANINKYNVVIRELSEELKISVADQFTKMNEDFDSYHSGDQKHFNNLGNDKMAEEWLDAIIGLEEPEPTPEKKIIITPILNLLL